MQTSPSPALRRFDYVLDMMSMALMNLSTLRIKGRVVQVVGTLIKACNFVLFHAFSRHHNHWQTTEVPIRTNSRK